MTFGSSPIAFINAGALTAAIAALMKNSRLFMPSILNTHCCVVHHFLIPSEQ